MLLLRLITLALGVCGLAQHASATGLRRSVPESQTPSRARDDSRAISESSNGNGPDCRDQWLPGFDLSNDTDQAYPSTGVVREYTLTITNTTCNPDGHGPVQCMLVNDQLPGPVISADWGDTVKVNVINSLQDNGTSVHFHGVRQLNSNSQDGVNGITECPLAPGKQKTYEWRATQYGSSWYHSHHTTQYGAGVFGPIVINGPTSANYDIDIGPVVLNEWFYEPCFAASILEMELAPQGKLGYTPDVHLLNGKAKDAQGNGDYAVVSVEQQKTHKLRLINTSTQSAMRFSIDSHQLLVVAADFVPIEPIVVESVMIGIGQRYDVIVTANQTAGAYWIHTIPESVCGASSKRGGFAVLKYADQDVNVPPGGEEAAPPSPVSQCTVLQDVKPIWPSSIGTREEYASQVQSIAYTGDTPPPSNSLLYWKFNHTAIDIEWQKPTLTYIAENNSSYPQSAAVIELPSEEEMAYWVIQSTGSNVSFLPHPIHLHGHDFYTLGRGQGTFDAGTAELNLVDPPRRDTDYVYGDGHTQQGSWMAMAFKTGNPGAWLLHCHISVHISGGFGLQFIDSKERIAAPEQSYYDECGDWNSYYSTAPYKKVDAGL